LAEEDRGRHASELVMEIFKPEDPVIAPGRPIDAAAHDESLMRLTECRALTVRTSPAACIEARKVRMFPGNTASTKQQEVGHHGITETATDACQPVRMTRPAYATRSNRRSVAKQIGRIG